jgi:hypothetical protein
LGKVLAKGLHMHVASIVLAFSLANLDPLAGELARFPPPEIVSANIQLNRAHSGWLEANEERLLPYDYDNWFGENLNLGHCWKVLSFAQRKECEPEKREAALIELKRILGTTNFFLGIMPPPSPIRRFFDFPLPEAPPEPQPA